MLWATRYGYEKFVSLESQPNVPHLVDDWLKYLLKRGSHPILRFKDSHFWLQKPQFTYIFFLLLAEISPNMVKYPYI